MARHEHHAVSASGPQIIALMSIYLVTHLLSELSNSRVGLIPREPQTSSTTRTATLNDLTSAAARARVSDSEAIQLDRECARSLAPSSWDTLGIIVSPKVSHDNGARDRGMFIRIPHPHVATRRRVGVADAAALFLTLGGRQVETHAVEVDIAVDRRDILQVLRVIRAFGDRRR